MIRRYLVGAALLTAGWLTAVAEPPKAKDSTKAAVQPVPLNRSGTVLLDRAGNRVLLKTHVVLRDQVLEMFCCLKQTKEHESILALGLPISRFDKNKDDVISKSEAPGLLKKHFDRLDLNKDGQLDPDEVRKADGSAPLGAAQLVHVGLLALGAKLGTPVRFVRLTDDGKFVPDYRPPTGQRIDVFVQWKDARGKRHRVPAQHWVRRCVTRYFVVKYPRLPDGLKLDKDSGLTHDAKNKELLWFGGMSAGQRRRLMKLSKDKSFRAAVESLYRQSQPTAMQAHWVFAGSQFRVDSDTGRKSYLAEGGYLICLANFPSALLDVTVESSKDAAGLLYEAHTVRIPPVGTEVLLELVPVKPVRQEKPGAGPASAADKQGKPGK